MRRKNAALTICLFGAGIVGCSTLFDEEVGSACADEACDSVGEITSGPQYDRYRNFTQNVAGIPGILPPNEQLHSTYRDMTESERRGLAAWHLFAGNGQYLREITWASEGMINMLKFLDSRERNNRFDRFGMLNDPGCRMNTEVDEFGLVLDACDDPYSSGVLGVRLMPNPAFSQTAWDAIGQTAGAFSDPRRKYDIPSVEEQQYGWEVEPPYLPSITCTLCHVSVHPLNPPTDPNNPEWNELAFAVGNQFFSESAFLGDSLPENEFARQVLFSQPAGTSDTSRVATDNIFNPSAINSIANLAMRPVFTEKLTPGTYNPDAYLCDDGVSQCADTYHVLKQGDDSSGPSGGILRVFVNIGSCTDHLVEGAGGLLDGQQQRPIVRARLYDECDEYKDLALRVEDILNYLLFTKPYYLRDAIVEGTTVSQRADDDLVTSDLIVLNRGKVIFAENCATCHSSIQPDDSDYDTGDPGTWFTEARNAFFRAAVMEPDFVSSNFLSDDRRYPNRVIGTHAARAVAPGAREGFIWEEYSSQTYKDLPLIADGGYYRPPSLINLWSSAPFLHNNELGLYNGRIDVEGRLEAFDDAIDQLLNPDRRPGRVRRTERFTKVSGAIDLGIFALPLPLPRGTMIDKWANKRADRATRRLIAANDYKVDQGHEFGSHLSDEDKAALIEYLKTF